MQYLSGDRRRLAGPHRYVRAQPARRSLRECLVRQRLVLPALLRSARWLLFDLSVVPAASLFSSVSCRFLQTQTTAKPPVRRATHRVAVDLRLPSHATLADPGRVRVPAGLLPLPDRVLERARAGHGRRAYLLRADVGHCRDLPVDYLLHTMENTGDSSTPSETIESARHRRSPSHHYPNRTALDVDIPIRDHLARVHHHGLSLPVELPSAMVDICRWPVRPTVRLGLFHTTVAQTPENSLDEVLPAQSTNGDHHRLSVLAATETAENRLIGRQIIIFELQKTFKKKSFVASCRTFAAHGSISWY